MSQVRETQEVVFVATLSSMGDKIVIFVPKLYHKQIQPLLNKQVIVRLKDLFEGPEKSTEVKYIGSVSPMGIQYIVYVLKRFHKDVKPLIRKEITVCLKEAN